MIRNFNVKNDAFDHSAYKYITEEKFEHVRRSEVKTGDVLISTKGTLGNVCLMPDLAGHSVLSATGTVRLHLPSEDKMRRLFLVSQMVMPTYTRYLRGFEAGSNQKYLNLASIRRMSVILPPIELQDKFLHIRERVKSLAARQAAAEEESGSLFAAIASIAFGGDGV